MQEATLHDIETPSEVEMADLTEMVGLEINAEWTAVTEHYVYTGSD
ncbi:hypothetical protein [Halobaculum sp. MBLA0143]